MIEVFSFFLKKKQTTNRKKDLPIHHLWLVHPRNVDLPGAVGALEGVGRKDGDPAARVVQRHEAGLSMVVLADQLQLWTLEALWQHAHIQKLPAGRD